MIATKTQLLARMDRAFPGAGNCVTQPARHKVGRLVAPEFADPARLARLGVDGFPGFVAARDVVVAPKVAERFVEGVSSSGISIHYFRG